MCPEPTRFFVMATDSLALRGELIAAAARREIGRPFRPQGRGDEGLDCVGLAARALAAAGWVLEVPRLPMRGHAPDEILASLRLAGFALREVEFARPGDLLLAFPATRQAHLAVRTGTGFVEAHAGLRRVVERPWSVGGWHSAWRLLEGCD